MKLEVKIPAVGESITEATIAEWTKKSGEFVEQDEIILVLETDKASVEVVAEKAGVLKTLVEEDETVDIGATVAEIDTEAQGASTGTAQSAPEVASASAPAASAQSPAAHPDLQKQNSPAVNKIVNEKNIDTSNIQGSGRGGRLTKGDVMNAPTAQTIQAPQAAAPAAKPAPAPVALPTPTGTFQNEETRKKMSPLRKKIAERLVQAQHTAAILTTFNEVDMTALIALRTQYKDQFKEKHGISLGFMGFFVKAVVHGLKSFPAVNAFIDGTDMVFHNYNNIGIAVGTPKGLVVPVVQNAEQLTIAQIEQSIRHYALKARDGKISLDDLVGGTFTISNGGVFGSLMSTPILNPPQSGILGMHKVEDRPVAINGKVEIRPMMYLALSYDHRVIDGSESVQFLVKVKECIEDPARLLLEI
ncbi:MAG: 2-oxoglutarate dehydrogenase complex dihydrolipoyllysine-residue succinyltransferase [Bdellovibrionaceae bacterium]|jgi:2-oxoglutarate dehydrogenase E2 component (dihydrolipoamide succinyltransferase)|nr:2-oxoglutarate dehydrogenase complex dihydrolipoyllysine-residue succinyltransferase [Pseudobdellovibrionaceae bacterium]